MGLAVGIDLGTTNTVVAAVKDRFPITLVDEQNRRLLPSIVSFHPSGKVLVGHSARERRIVDAQSTIFSVKRLIGRPWESIEVQKARKLMPFELVEGDAHEVQVVARGETYTLPEISAFILRRAKAIAEAALGQPVRQAVVTVPANFNDLQREATKLAGKLAGLEVLRIVSEPTAAALAYGESVGKKERVAVYDLGGGTFDVTILDVSGSVFQVLATGGDTALGGDDIDDLVAGLMFDSLLRQHRVDPRTDPTARATVKARAEELKILLSTNTAGEVSLDKIVRGEGGAFLPASFSLDRRVLETLSAPLIDRTLEASRRALEKVGMKINEVDRVLLVGGSTRMPLVGKRVEDYFQRKVSARVNPDEVVAHGAAIQAAALARGEEVARPSFRPRPSFSFAPGIDIPAPPAAPSAASAASADAYHPLPTPRVGDVMVPEAASSGRPSSVPPGSPTPARTSQPPPRTSRSLLPRTSPDDAAASQRLSSPPLSQDQELLLKAFLGVPPAASPPRSVPPSSGSGSIKPPKAVESELMAFLSDAPPPPDDGVVIEPESLEAPDLDLPPLSKPPASQKPPQVVAIESELEAFLLEDRTMPSASTAIASVVDQPAPPPLPNRGSPTLPSQVSRPSQTGMPAQTAHPAPVISERQSASPAPLSGPPRGASTSPLLIDVTPLSLGVETVGGFCDIIIRANSPVPCDRSRIFRTASDNQTAVVVKVCQGESDRFLENTTLGDLRLSGFRAAPRGEVEISVTFEIDADGILNVQAKETSTGRSAVARIELLGAHMDPKKMQAMIERQARREVA